MRLTKKLRNHKVKRPRMVRREADRAKVPLHIAMAVLEKETGIPQRNIFGCDHGYGKAFCHLKVTRDRVKWLLANGIANGIGWTQLTWPPLVRLAEKLGRADKPRWQLRVGLGHLRNEFNRTGSWFEALWAYNGARQYAVEAIEIADKWKRRLN